MPSGASRPILRISDQLFRLERAEWCAHVSLDEDGWDVSWHLDFDGESREVHEMSWQPSVRSHFFHEKLPPLSALPGREFRLGCRKTAKRHSWSTFFSTSRCGGRLRFGACGFRALLRPEGGYSYPLRART